MARQRDAASIDAEFNNAGLEPLDPFDSVVVPDRESARRLERLLKARYQSWLTDDVGPKAFPQGDRTPNKRINLTRPSAAISFSRSARRLCARRWAGNRAVRWQADRRLDYRRLVARRCRP